MRLKVPHDITDPSKSRALKMDGIKLLTDIIDGSKICLVAVVGRRTARAEVSS